MKRKLTGILTKIVILALIVYAGVSLVKLVGQIDQALAAKAELEDQVDKQQVQIDELLYDIEHSGDDDVISDYAREKLGLAYEDELVFYGD